MKIYVSAKSRGGDGSREYPLNSIAQAAKLAMPGDEVIVAPGIYREYVNPANGGTKEQRIVYRSEVKGAAVISGAERIQGWVPYQGNAWMVRIQNSLFGDWNPYREEVFGDWYDAVTPAHTGEVYLNDKSLYETDTIEAVVNPVKSERSWDPEGSLYTWHAEQDGDATVIYANFQGADPNEEMVEINVRRNCFYPSEEGRGYITLSGFTVTKAATQWAPPTAYQEGMVGPHWSKGWIIEDCEISHSKCSGISLGKYLQPDNDNKWALKRTKTGTQTERDAICQAQREGWTKENIGSHIVRRCNIHDCGQTGIVGHLGCVFSIIEDNDIHHISFKQNLAGAEIGGIKFHAAIDVIIRRNKFHHCTRGLWLDWQAQGTRVTQNVFYENMPPEETKELTGALAEDLFVEVSHGPTLIDNNIFLSDFACRFCTQGIAMVHNLVAGSLTGITAGDQNGAIHFPSPRYTPYHVPHRTEINGFMTILHGDARFYNNVFVQRKVRSNIEKFAKETQADNIKGFNLKAGTFPFEGFPDAETYFEQFRQSDYKVRESRDKYYDHLPVYAGGNVFFNGAKPYSTEQDYDLDETNEIFLELTETDDGLMLKTNLMDYLPDRRNQVITTGVLGEAFEPEECFEYPDGSPITFNEDFFGKHRPVYPASGPFEKGEEKEHVFFIG